jgi:SET domain
MAVDPSDLSSLYFRESIRAGDDNNDADRTLRPYVHPALVVASSPLHGRGLMATNDISPGTCLFVTPPVIKADVGAVFERYKNQTANANFQHQSSHPPIDSSGLERTAEHVLLEAFRSELQAKSLKARSALSLAGSSTAAAPPLSSLHSTSIDLLTGQDTEATRELVSGEDAWCYELDPTNVPDSYLLEIIRHNAFGPDFMGYDRLQERVDAGDDSHYRPFHLLGMYPLAAMINHSCVSNAVRVFAGEVMVVHASQPICAGAEVVWSYVPPVDPFRGEVLQAQYGVVCRCEQCLVQQRLSVDQLSFLDARTRQLLSKFNRRGVAVEWLDPSECGALMQLVPLLEHELSRGGDESALSNSDKRYLRLGWMHLYLNYLNLAASGRWAESGSNTPDLVPVLMQLHLAFCASHNASTEHLSVRSANLSALFVRFERS